MNDDTDDDADDGDDDSDDDGDDYDNEYNDHDYDGDDIYGCTSISYDRYWSRSVLEVSFDPRYHLPIYLRYIM